MSGIRLLSFTALVLLLGAAPAAVAGQRALGASGEVYRVRPVVIEGNGALAFEIQRPGSRKVDVELVPGTEDEDIESNPALVFEEQSGAAFVLWQRMVGGAFPVLNLSSRDETGWSPVIEIRGNPFAFKTAPQLLITRDVANLGPQAKAQHRTIIHVAWAEEDGVGTYDTFYTPLILEDGAYIGRNAVYRLAAFHAAAAAAGDVADGLLRAPRLQSGNDGASVRLVFGDGNRGRITNLEVRVLPRGLVALGDGARAHIIGASKDLDAKNLANLAASTRAQILAAGGEVRPAVLRALADEASLFIQSWKPASGGPSALADGARAHIIGVGSDLGNGLRNVVAASPSAVREIAAAAGAAHALRFTVTASRPAPAIGEGQAYALFGSVDGNESTVAWATEERLSYRESVGAGWGPERELKLDAEFDLADALAVLAERAAGR